MAIVTATLRIRMHLTEMSHTRIVMATRTIRTRSMAMSTVTFHTET